MTLNDGRFPTEEDYDFHSAMYGADTVRVTSDSEFWENKNHNTAAGVVMVVAVKFKGTGNYTLLLTSKSNQPI